jgi:hypothetical protein
MDNGTRGEFLDRLAGVIESVTATHPLRVAVDGPPAAGKTTLADGPDGRRDPGRPGKKIRAAVSDRGRGGRSKGERPPGRGRPGPQEMILDAVPGFRD